MSKASFFDAELQIKFFKKGFSPFSKNTAYFTYFSYYGIPKMAKKIKYSEKATQFYWPKN